MLTSTVLCKKNANSLDILRIKHNFFSVCRADGSDVEKAPFLAKPVQLTPAWEANNLPNDELNFKGNFVLSCVMSCESIHSEQTGLAVHSTAALFARVFTQTFSAILRNLCNLHNNIHWFHVSWWRLSSVPVQV